MLPCECKNWGTDITKIRDITEEEVEEIISQTNKENVETLMQLREDVFDDVAGNIHRAQKRQKKNYDARHSDRAKFLQIGDIVVKLNMVNKNREGGKFDKIVSDELYIVENFIQNGNIVI